jgi:hypothetical protein
MNRGHPSSRSRIASWSSVRRTYNCIVVAMSSCPMTFASLFGTMPSSASHVPYECLRSWNLSPPC